MFQSEEIILFTQKY